MRKVRKGRVFILLVVIVVLIVAGILVFRNKNVEKENKDNKEIKETKNERVSYKESLSINLGEELPLCKDYIEECIEDINWEEEFTDNKASKVGTYNGVINYKELEYNISVVVNDITPPQISGVKNLTTYVGVKIDLLKNIKVTDDSGEDVKANVIGTYDFNKKGTYSLMYEAIDNSGNKKEEKFTLNVIEKPVSNTNTNSNVPDGVVGVSKKGYEIKKVKGIYYVGGILVANKTYDLPSTYNPGGLLASFNTAFSKMKSAAAKDGVTLTVISGFRSYSTQTNLYNNYVARDGKAAADRYSARPGHSEHQTGLAADLNQISDSFGETKAGKWLAANCWKYGFILRYPKGKEAITGYMYESWHFRYIGDTKITEVIYNNGNWSTLEEYLGIDSKYK